MGEENFKSLGDRQQQVPTIISENIHSNPVD